MKKLLKKLGRVFLILTYEDKNISADSQGSILIVGTGEDEHLRTTINCARARFEHAKLSVLTHPDRITSLVRNFSVVKIFYPARSPLPKRYQLAGEMFKLRKADFDLIILMSLDISPIIVSLSFMKARLLLYNRWNEWYLLRFRTTGEVLKGVRSADVKLISEGEATSFFLLKKILLFLPKFIFCLIIYSYLLVSVMFFLLKRSFPIMRLKFAKRT